MYICGSTALRYWFSDFNREPKDLDIFVQSDDPDFRAQVGDTKTEYLWNPIICKKMNNQGSVHVIPPLLLTNLMSHIFWEDKFFDKRMWDLSLIHISEPTRPY